ncbi:MAG: DUF3618 domain-containing protein [Propionibacteriaceae bacterium]|jgi:hypothetical protein|nr:DUF3618 domain-containing protein [Propionibacteriaceae bacterium]
MALERTAEAIERDLADARQRLAENISQLITEVHPRAVTHRAIQENKRKVKQGIDKGKEKLKDTGHLVMSFFKDDSGWKPVPVAAAGVAVAVLAVIVLAKK